MEKLRIDIKDKYECSGCSACASMCPKHCIQMIPDELGFKYPSIDEAICINCGLCLKVCPFNKNYETPDNYTIPQVYAARLKNEAQLIYSQSGGLFYAISEFVLDNHGIVYGAGLTDEFQVIHKRATTKTEREELRLSKYSQSDILSVYCKVKEDIENKKQVLFTGTPCQVAGVKKYLGKLSNTEFFLSVDLVCHGVPSPKIWCDFLVYIHERYRQPIMEVSFRNKKFGWESHIESIRLRNGRVINSTTFRDLFYDHYSVRLSCSRCPFSNLRRVGDITIGDYWGWRDTHSEFNDNLGLSLVLVNTVKGTDYYSKIKALLNDVASNIHDCLQPQLTAPLVLPHDRFDFEKAYLNKGFLHATKKYGNLGIRYWIRNLRETLYRYKRGLLHKFRMIFR